MAGNATTSNAAGPSTSAMTTIPIVALDSESDGRSPSPQTSSADSEEHQPGPHNGDSGNYSDAEAGPSRSNPPVFDEFFSACSSRLKLPGDEKILVKLRKRYMEMDEDFRESSECQTLLESFIEQVKEQSNTYIILKEVIENFKAQARSAADPTASKKARIKKLERFLEKLDKEIKKLQEKEVDFDEEENSDYILECRLKARFARVYAELCRLVGAIPTEPRAKITFNGTRYPEINRNIRKYVNRRKNEFPDYTTILNIIKATNEESDLHLSDSTLDEIARVAFKGVGEELKQMRVKEFKFTLGCHLTDPMDNSDESNDPASADAALKQKLEENQALANKRLEEVVEKFAAEQEALKEEPVEVGDDELDSVPGSDDEEEDDFAAGNEVEEEDEVDIDQLVDETSPGVEEENAPTNGHSEPSDSADSRPASSNDDHPPSDIVIETPTKKEAAILRVNGNQKETKVQKEVDPLADDHKPRILKRSIDCLKDEDFKASPAKVARRVELKTAQEEDDDCITLSD